jgi:hypothetical protein
MEMIANQSLYDGSSDAFVLKNAPIFTPRYRQVLHSALTDGRCAEQIHIFALSAALQLTIQSYCAPGTQNVEGCHPYTMSVSTGTFSAGISYTDLTVMWSNNKYSGGAQPPDPNHFVLLIPTQGSASPRRTAEQRSDCVTVNVSLGDTDTPAGLMPVSQSTPRVDSNTSFRACSTSVNGDEGNLCDANDSVIIVDSSSSDDIGDCRSQTVALQKVDDDGDIQSSEEPDANGEITEAAAVRAATKRDALQDVFKSASEIVEQNMQTFTGPDFNGSFTAFTNPRNLARAGNRARQKHRPKDPVTLDFDLDENYIPENFLRKDIRKHHQRHLLFATDLGLQLLSQADTWFVDGTFKVVSPPFSQLLTVHAYVSRGSNDKQFPLVFCLMSRRKAKDYRAVLRAIRCLVPSAVVTSIVSDFERGLWLAVADVYGHVTQRGCAFHWCQAVWRRVQSLGLQSHYQRDAQIRRFCRRLFALHLVPEADVGRAFNKVDRKARRIGLQPLSDLVEYIRATWIDGELWTPHVWSAYRQTVRTNNGVEGWHNRLNLKAHRHTLALYLLIMLLDKEASTVTWQYGLLEAGHAIRERKRLYADMDDKLNNLWTEYDAGRITVSKFLSSAGHIYCPVDLH